MKVQALNEATGEVIELDVTNLESLVQAWRVAAQYSKAADKLKDQLKKLVPKYVDDSGNSEECDNHQFKVISVQRMNYDQSVMRRVLDEDLYDTLMKPNKTAVDSYLKENVENLGAIGDELRQSMVAEGKPYEVIKLEKLTR